MQPRVRQRSPNVDCKHYLMIDARFMRWDCGRSYLCRIVDVLHVGYVDEVPVGTEALEWTPELAKEWVAPFRAKGGRIRRTH